MSFLLISSDQDSVANPGRLLPLRDFHQDRLEDVPEVLFALDQICAVFLLQGLEIVMADLDAGRRPGLGEAPAVGGAVVGRGGGIVPAAMGPVDGVEVEEQCPVEQHEQQVDGPGGSDLQLLTAEPQAHEAGMARDGLAADDGAQCADRPAQRGPDAEAEAGVGHVETGPDRGPAQAADDGQLLFREPENPPGPLVEQVLVEQ